MRVCVCVHLVKMNRSHHVACWQFEILLIFQTTRTIYFSNWNNTGKFRVCSFSCINGSRTLKRSIQWECIKSFLKYILKKINYWKCLCLQISFSFFSWIHKYFWKNIFEHISTIYLNLFKNIFLIFLLFSVLLSLHRKIIVAQM